MEKNKEKPKMEAGVKSFITAIVVIFAMMVLTYALTIIIPGGYIPFWKWILSPILVLFAKDSGSMIAIIALLVVLGGIFNTLDKFGVLRLLLDKVTAKFGKSRRVLLAVIPLFFMVIGSAAGTAGFFVNDVAIGLVSPQGQGVDLQPVYAIPLL